jgi:(2Fe-2S) ferredoxin
MPKPKIVVCTKGKTCRKRGAKDVFCALEAQLEELGLEKQICLKKSDCLGRCGRGPTVKVKPDKYFYSGVRPSDCHDIIASLIRKTGMALLKLKKA